MPKKISEDQTRKEMIDPQLEKVGWFLRDHSKYTIQRSIVLTYVFIGLKPLGIKQKASRLFYLLPLCLVGAGMFFLF